jgi:hypothetical protein
VNPKIQIWRGIGGFGRTTTLPQHLQEYTSDMCIPEEWSGKEKMQQNRRRLPCKGDMAHTSTTCMPSLAGAHLLRCLDDHLFDGDHLDFENKVRVGRNVRRSSLLAVAEMGGNGNLALTANLHAGNTNVPALDDLADTELEGEGRSLLVGWKMLASIIGEIAMHRQIESTHHRRPCRSSLACRCTSCRYGRPSWHPLRCRSFGRRS